MPKHLRGNVLTNNLSRGDLCYTALISSIKMDDKGNNADFESTYNKLTYPEETGADDHPFYSNRERQQVSLSTLRSASPLNHYKVLAVSLAVLAAILLAADIGLGVYYNRLTNGNNLVTDISTEIAKLQVTYNAAIQSSIKAKTELAKEIEVQQIIKWELEHLKRRKIDYENQMDKIQTELATLKSHMPMLKDGCRHCLPGWTFINSWCYYLPFSDEISRKPWLDARNFCKRQGSDLVVINSREEHLALAELIKNYQDPLRPMSHSGFWMGLRDADVEGVWRWLDGTRLAEGYWNTGEPNNQNNEDCAAMYPKDNPFFAWNDAPCNWNLKWICERTPRTFSSSLNV
ncbi:C-type lectin domain family 4 member M-like [Archocentrus centrarchus]|uniref:C-type lectin domain family 4 member M-like n=1 Tax=Archocentrus centrarchus TaxID=63155 RepID=UPI0011E9F9A2|nr:C-type lectin domain family 4 member M-like [Archocentrus centrarchus]